MDYNFLILACCAHQFCAMSRCNFNVQSEVAVNPRSREGQVFMDHVHNVTYLALMCDWTMTICGQGFVKGQLRLKLKRTI